eukprot:2095290-Rhodomonas_salina.1
MPDTATPLPLHYAVSGTETAHGATRSLYEGISPCGSEVTDTAYAAICLRASYAVSAYAVSGTDLGHGGIKAGASSVSSIPLWHRRRSTGSNLQ